MLRKRPLADLDPSVRPTAERYAQTFELDDLAKTTFDIVLDVVLRPKRFVSFPIKVEATTGLPQLTRDVRVKTDILHGWRQNGRRYVELYTQRDLRRLLHEHDVTFAYINAFRSQLDPTKMEDGRAVAAKDRQVYTADGEFEPMDRTLPEKEDDINRQLCTTRSRTVAVCSYSGGMPARPVARACTDSLPEFTCKHRGKADIEKKLAMAVATSKWDVKSHDQAMNAWLVDRIAEKLGALFNAPKLGEWIKHLLHAPMWVHRDRRGERGTVLRGDPTDLDSFKALYANPSGIPITSIIAICVGIFYIVDALVRAGVLKADLDHIDAFLHGRTHAKDGTPIPVFLLNLGDNNVLCARTAAVAEIVRNINKYTSFCVLEETQSFGGWSVIKTSRGYELERSIQTLVKNLVSPDRDMSNPMKGNWAVSLGLKQEMYSGHAAYPAVWKEINEAIETHLGTTLEALAALTPRDPEIAKVANLMDQEFLENPDGLNYKFDIEDVSPELLALFYITGRPEDGELIISHFQ
jgi:hypothetical protein